MNILKKIKKIVLFNKIIKEIKFVKKIIKQNDKLANDVKNIIGYLKADIEALIKLLPSLKAVYDETMDDLRND